MSDIITAADKLAEVLRLARVAVEYHRLGYESFASFDANTMIEVMDELGAALDKLDADDLRKPAGHATTLNSE